MTFEESNPNTPVTNQVRDQRGDYLAAVEELEASHAMLLKAAEVAELRILECSVFNNVPGIQSQPALIQIRAAIAQAKEVVT